MSLKDNIRCAYLRLSDADADNAEIAANITELAELANIIKDRITTAAHETTSAKRRRITGKNPGRSPLGYTREPDDDFRCWCEIGAAYTAVMPFAAGGRNLFQGSPRVTIATDYRAGKSVVQVCTDANHKPKPHPTQQ